MASNIIEINLKKLVMGAEILFGLLPILETTKTKPTFFASFFFNVQYQFTGYHSKSNTEILVLKFAPILEALVHSSQFP
jgi:hypothetical protein